jgi:hypothetical protein
MRLNPAAFTAGFFPVSFLPRTSAHRVCLSGKAPVCLIRDDRPKQCPNTPETAKIPASGGEPAVQAVENWQKVTFF